MKFKNNKCIEITQTEYNHIKYLISASTCLADAVRKTMDYLKNDNQDKAFNLVMDVENGYKYMKIVL